MDSPKNQKSKKNYTKPSVKTYGNISEMTNASVKKGRDDGAMGMTDKTI